MIRRRDQDPRSAERRRIAGLPPAFRQQRHTLHPQIDGNHQLETDEKPVAYLTQAGMQVQASDRKYVLGPDGALRRLGGMKTRRVIRELRKLRASRKVQLAVKADARWVKRELRAERRHTERELSSVKQTISDNHQAMESLDALRAAMAAERETRGEQ